MERRRRASGRVWAAAGLCLMLVLASAPASTKSEPHMPTLVRLEESVPGPAATEETCTIVYLDGQYHAERVSHKTGGRPTAEVYEGALSVAEFNRLMMALESSRFRKLKSPPRQSPSPAAEDSQPLQIMVPRADRLQDLNYPTLASRKRHEKALRPVLEWWKDLLANLPPALKRGASWGCNPGSASTR